MRTKSRSFLYRVDPFAGWWSVSEVPDDDELVGKPIAYLPSERECEEMIRWIVDKENAKRRKAEKDKLPRGGRKTESDAFVKDCFIKGRS